MKKPTTIHEEVKAIAECERVKKQVLEGLPTARPRIEPEMDAPSRNYNNAADGFNACLSEVKRLIESL